MLELQFHSLNAFFWMEGHGPYVWSAFALALVGLAFLVWRPLAGRRRFLRQLREALVRQQLHEQKPLHEQQPDAQRNSESARSKGN